MRRTLWLLRLTQFSTACFRAASGGRNLAASVGLVFVALLIPSPLYGQTGSSPVRRLPPDASAATSGQTASPPAGRSAPADAAFPSASLPVNYEETTEPSESQRFGDATRLESADETVESLMKRLTDVEAKLKQRDDADKKKAAADKAKEEGWQDVSQEKWTVKLGGHVQMDYVNWAQAPSKVSGAQDYFEFRRLRLVADGTGYGIFDFRLQMTLEPETVGETLPLGTVMSPDVKDAYLSMNEIPILGRCRVGNFFVPFGLEQVTNDTNNIFMERSLPSQGIFTADREVGIACYNSTEDKNISWAYGAFFDSISEGLKERIDDNQGYRLSGRLVWLPFYDEPSNGRYLLHTGVGVLYTDDQDDRVRFRARPQIHEGPRLIDSGVLNASSYTTGNLEAALVWGSVTLQSEAFLSNVNMLTGDNVSTQGAYAHMSYFLTGENRMYERFGQHGAQFARNVPHSNFFVVPGGYGSGAWEFKTRWSYLDLNNVNKGQYNDLTVGFNWYWSDRTRVMFDWIHPMTSSQTVFGASSLDLLAMRFDFNW